MHSLSKGDLKKLLLQPGLSKTDRILLILSYNDCPKTATQVRNIAREASCWEISEDKNVGALLSMSKATIKTPKGWALTSTGKADVSDMIESVGADILQQKPDRISEVEDSLRQHAKKINDDRIAAFVEEAISCFEHCNYRAAVVLSWVGTIGLLHKIVADNHLQEFNSEVIRINSKWKKAKNPDDLSRMKESDFLDILPKLSIIGKNVKNELKGCLRLRNSCGHPNSLQIRENQAAAHLENLILNVFEPISSGKIK